MIKINHRKKCIQIKYGFVANVTIYKYTHTHTHTHIYSIYIYIYIYIYVYMNNEVKPMIEILLRKKI